MKPLVSIITPCYNAAKFISKTIDSVLQQTYDNWEMLIVDDFSSDNSIAIIKSYQEKDKRIKLVQLSDNGGAAVCRNTAIEKAHGKYIAFLDSDDLWMPEKLSVQISFMEENNYPLTYTAYQKINEAGDFIENGTVIVAEKLNYKDMLSANKIGCLTAVYNANVLGKVYMPLIRKRQDYGLWLKILKEIPFAIGLQEQLAYYRIRENSISSSKLEMLYWNWRLFRKVEKMSLLNSLILVFKNTQHKLKSLR